MDYSWRVLRVLPGGCSEGSSVNSSNGFPVIPSGDPPQVSLDSSSERSSKYFPDILLKSPPEIPAKGPPAISHDQHPKTRRRAPTALHLEDLQEIPRVVLNFSNDPNTLHVPRAAPRYCRKPQCRDC